MAKSKKVVSKKVVAPVEVVPVEAPAVPASEPVQAEAVPPTPVSAPVPATDKRARKGRAAETPVDPAAETRARWKRRLGRWQAKAVAAGVDLDLVKLPDKRAVEKFCRDAVVTKAELSDFIWAAKLGDLTPYKYACHFEQLVPEHLLPTDDDKGALAANGTGEMGPGAQKFVRKIGQLFKDRRVFSAHLLYEPTKTYWHLICFDQRDMDIGSNHWKKGGSHVHYSRESYVNASLDEVWGRILAKPPKTPASEHLRFEDVRERGFVGPGDSE